MDQAISSRSSDQDNYLFQGILSNNLIPGSRAHAILPAYLRHPKVQDVVFVYNNYVLVSELKDEKLQNLTRKDDFDSVIHAARVLGSLVPSPAYAQSSISDHDMQADSLNGHPRTDGVAADMETTMERSPLPFQPQMLIATLRRGNRDSLAFLYAREPKSQGAVDTCELAHFQRPLPPPQGDRETYRYGRHLAVDSKSRLIAVAADEKHLVLYRLKARSEWNEGSASPGDGTPTTFDPIAEEHRLIVNGSVHKIEFLESPKSEPNTVVLLLILGTDNHKTVMRRFDWDSTKTLLEGLSPEWAQGFPLEPSLANSQIMMPLCTDIGFILVVADVMARFTEILSGSPKVTYFRLPTEESARARREPTTGPLPVRRNLTRWTAWAKPLRRTDFLQDYDHFYLCREDGMFQFCELTKGSGSLFNTNIKLDITNDTAFAVLDADGYSELAITSNGLFRLFVQKDPHCEQPFFDWSPMHDFECIKHDTKPSLITCSSHGQGLHSKNIHSIYSAFKATCEEVAIGQSSVFALPNGDDDICLVSTIEDTRLYPIPALGPAKVELDSQLHDLFENGVRTVAAGRTSDGLVVQVTPWAVRASLPNTPPTVLNLTEYDGPIIMAAFDPEAGDLLLIIQRNGNFLLQYYEITMVDSSACFRPDRKGVSSDAVKIFSQPTAVGIAWMRTTKTVWAAVGTWENELLLVKIGVGDSPYLTHKLKVPGALFESIRMVDRGGSKTSSGVGEVICGLRDGSVERYTIDDEHEQLVKCERRALGSGPVSIEMLGKDILAVCDEQLYRAPLDTGQGHGSIRFYAVALFQDNGNQLHIPVRKASVLPQWATNRSHIVLLESDGHPFLAHLQSNLSHVAEPRVIFVQEPSNDLNGHAISNDENNIIEPSHILATSLGVVIAYQEAVLMDGRANDAVNGHMNGDGHESSKRRQVFFRLGLLDGDAALRNKRSPETDVMIGNHSGNVVRAIAEWKVESRRLKSSLIAVCVALNPTSRNHDGKAPSGRIYLFGPRRDPRSPSELCSVYRIKFPDPVHTTAQVRSDLFVVCHGTSISLVQLHPRPNPNKPDSSSSEFRITKTAGLRSPGGSIAIKKMESGRALLYVATKDTLEILDDDLNNLAFGPGYCNIKGRVILTGSPDPVVLIPVDGGIKGFRDRIAEQFTSSPDNFGNQIKIPRFAVQEIFEARLMSTITQIREHPSKPNVYIGGDRYGAFHQLRVITHAEWRMLKYIQNMAEQDAQICPFTYEDKRRFPRLNPVWRPRMDKSEMHVNGDIIARVIRHGVPKLLHLIRIAVPGDYDLGFEEPSGRLDRLKELTSKVLMDKDANDDEMVVDGHIEREPPDPEDTILGQIVVWLRDMLDPCT